LSYGPDAPSILPRYGAPVTREPAAGVTLALPQNPR